MIFWDAFPEMVIHIDLSSGDEKFWEEYDSTVAEMAKRKKNSEKNSDSLTLQVIKRLHVLVVACTVRKRIKILVSVELIIKGGVLW